MHLFVCLGVHNQVMSPIKEIIAEPHVGYKNTGFLETSFTSFNYPSKLRINIQYRSIITSFLHACPRVAPR